MAVFTQISLEQIKNHLQKYDLGEVISFVGIIDGIDNTNYVLETTKGKFIFTIFESRIAAKDLPFFVNLKLHLASKGLSCPAPVLDKERSAIVEIVGKKSAIVTFLSGKVLKSQEDGYYNNITPDHCFAVGKMMAQMHVAAQDFNFVRENDLGISGFGPLFSKFEHLVENYQKNLGEEILQTIDLIEKSWKFDLPSVAAHLDLFPDNVFFDEKNAISGVIDFYFAANDLMVYDFAIAVNAWCFDEKNIFSTIKFDEMLRGYESIRKFADDEKKFLAIALIAASLRFALTRMHDMFFTPKNSYVKIKNPQEYLTKLSFFKSKIWP